MNRWSKEALYKRMKEKKVSKKRQDGMFDAYKRMQAIKEEEKRIAEDAKKTD